MQNTIEALDKLDELKEESAKKARANVLSQTDKVDLNKPVVFDPRAMRVEAHANAKRKKKLTEKLLYTNAGNFQDSFKQTMAAVDHGGFFGPASMRSVSNRVGGMTELGYTFKEADRGGLARMLQAGAEHGTLEGENPMDEASLGWPVYETLLKWSRGIEDAYDWWTGNTERKHIYDSSIDDYTRKTLGLDQMKFEQERYRYGYAGAADTVGTPIYDIIHKTDGEFSKDKKDHLVALIFDNPQMAQMASIIGLNKEELYKARSYGHAMAIMNTKTVAFEAAQYTTHVAGGQFAWDFASNLGATIISDPEMITEFILTAGLGTVAMAGKGIASGGFKLSQTGLKSYRAFNAAEVAAKTSGINKVLKLSIPATARVLGRGLYEGGTVISRVGAGLGAVNPFTLGERVVWPAFTQSRMLSKGGELLAKTARGKELRAAVQANKLGASGVLLRNVLFNNTDTTLKGTLLSAMVDGGFQNYLAYAYTRDEEWAFTSAVMGDDADPAHIAYQFHRGDGFMNFMNSGVGAYTLGMGFGSIMGLTMRGLSINALDVPSIKAVEGHDLPILKNPVAVVKSGFKKLKKRLEANAENIKNSSASFAAQVAEGGRNSALLASLHIQGTLARAGTLTQNAIDNLDAIIVSAMLQGVNVQRLVRRLSERGIEGGTLDLKLVKSFIADEVKTKTARARRRVLNRGGASSEMKIAAMAYNNARIEHAIENGIDFGEGGHLDALNRLIASTEEGSLRDTLIVFRDNVFTFTDDVLNLIKEQIRGWENWDALDNTTKQRILDSAVSAVELEGKTIKLEDFEAAVRTVGGKDVARRQARERKVAEANFEAARKAQEEAEAEAASVPESRIMEPEGLDGMNRNFLNPYIDENKVPGGKGGTNEEKIKRIRDWISEQNARFDAAEAKSPEKTPTTDNETTRAKSIAADPGTVVSIRNGTMVLGHDADGRLTESVRGKGPLAEGVKGDDVALHAERNNANLKALDEAEVGTTVSGTRMSDDGERVLVVWTATKNKYGWIIKSDTVVDRVKFHEGDTANLLTSAENYLNGNLSSLVHAGVDVLSFKYPTAPKTDAGSIKAEAPVDVKVVEDLLKTRANKSSPKYAVLNSVEKIRKFFLDRVGLEVSSPRQMAIRPGGHGRIALEVKIKGQDVTFVLVKEGDLSGNTTGIFVPVKEVDSKGNVILDEAFGNSPEMVSVSRKLLESNGVDGKGKPLKLKTGIDEKGGSLDPFRPASSDTVKTFDASKAESPASKVESPASKVESEQEQLIFDFKDREPAEIAREIATEALLGDAIKENALRDTVDGPGVSAMAKDSNVEATTRIDSRLEQSLIKHLIDLSDAAEADARRSGIDVEWNIKEVVKRTQARADTVKDVFDRSAVDELTDAILAKLPKKGKLAAIKRLIYKEFGIDLTIKKEGKVVDSAKLQDLQTLYRDLRMFRKLSDLEPEAKAKLAEDPILAVAVGKPEAQIALARQLVDNLNDLADSPPTANRLTAEQANNAMPAGFEGLLFTVFKDAESRAGDVTFDTKAMLLEAQRRLAFADEDFRKAYIEKANARKADLEPAQKEVIDSLLQFHNESANTRAFLARRSGANTEGVNHRERVSSRLKTGDTLDKYLIREKEGFIKGILDGWKALHRGAFKDNLARRLGIVDLANQDILFTAPKQGRLVTPEVLKRQIELATRIWDQAHVQAGITKTDPVLLMDGRVDSQRGYHLGRATIEAVSGHVSPSTRSAGALAGETTKTGYLGRMSNKDFVRMFQKFTRESVIEHVLSMGSGRIDGTSLRYLTAEDVDVIIKDLTEVRDAIRSGNITKEVRERFNKVGYEAHERLTLAPKSTLKDLDQKITSIEKYIKDEIDNVLNTPPGGINMLHDEMSIGKAVQDIIFIKGDTGPDVVTLDPSVSGDIGLKSGRVTPASWKDIWNLRSESLFGSTQGFSRIASVLGLENLQKAIEDYDGDLLAFIRDLEKMNNAEDASSQAVTMAQAILRDFGGVDDKKAQADFSEVLNKVNYLFENAGGLSEIRSKLDEAARDVEAKYLADPSKIDKYSQVALRFLRERPPSDAWAKLFALSRTPEDATALNTKSAGDGDISGEIGLLLRKKVFKPPVMTIVYGAGAPAFRKQILEGLEEVASVIARTDPDGANNLRLSMNKMADELVDEIVSNDLIRKELGLPTSTELIKLFRNRPLSNDLRVSVTDKAGKETGEVKVFTVEDIISEDWLRGEHSGSVWRHLINLSQREFSVASPELGLWYAKLLVNNDKVKTQRAVDNVRKKVKDSLDDDGVTLNLDKLNEKFTPINTYLSSLDSANRTGFLLDNKVVGRHMRRLSVREEDLDPIVARALNHHIALYQNTGPAAGRKFGYFDGPIIVRNQNPETTVHEVLRIENYEQIGQAVLDDGFKNMMGLRSEGIETRVRDAVVKQLLIEIGSILAPTRLGDDTQFKYRSMGEFYRGIYEQENMGNPAARRVEARNRNQDRVEELKAKGIAKLNDEEQLELAELIQFESTVNGKDEDGNYRLTSGSSLLAGNIRSEAHFDVHSDIDRPTTLGVPYLQELAFSTNNAAIRMETFDVATQKGIASSTKAFSAEEVTPESLLHPEFRAKARENQKPLPRHKRTDEQMAEDMGQRSKESIDTESNAERVYAEERGFTVNGVRLTRLVRRLERQMEGEIRYAKLYFRGDELEQRLKGIRRRFLSKIQRGWQSTTGTAMSKKDAKRNAFKFPKRPIKYRTRGDLTLLEALQSVIRDNDIREMTGLMLGPSERLGIDLRKLGQTDNIMPFSSARAPMTVFALDWYLMGGTSRDYIMYTIAKIANKEGVDFGDIIKRTQEDGFSATLSKFLDKHYDNLDTPEKAGQYFVDAEEAKAQLDDRYATEFGIEIKSINDTLDAEFGIEIPPLPKGLSLTTDEKVRFVGIQRYLEDDLERVQFINKATGMDLNAEQIALNYSLSRERLLELSNQDDPETVFIPRQVDAGERGLEINSNEIDRINSRDISDENVRPDQMPLFSADQILHLLNMPANRNLVANLLLHQLTGVDINMQMRLDNQVRDFADGYVTGEEPHGFATHPRSEIEAEMLVDVEGGNSLYGLGVIAKDRYGLSIGKSEDLNELEAARFEFDWMETYGGAQLVFSLRLADDGVLTPEGVTLLTRLGITEPSQVTQVLRSAEDIKNKVAEAEDLRDVVRLDETTASRTEDMEIEDGRIRAERAAESDEEPSPFRDGPEDVLPASPNAEDAKGSFIDISSSTEAKQTEAGQAFRHLLGKRADAGSAASRNILAFFDSMTGRDGQAKTGEAISDAEAMTLLELSFVDKDISRALFGGDVTVEFAGNAHVEIIGSEGSRLRTVFRGLAEVNQKMKQGRVDSAVYTLIHELVERLDLGSQVTSRGHLDSRDSKGRVKSAISTHFITNFGTKQAREKWVGILKGLGVYDEKMQRFIKATEDLFESRSDIRAERMDDALYEARKALSTEDEDSVKAKELRDIINEGYTQALTLALFSRNVNRVGEDSPMRGLKTLAGFLKTKLSNMVNFLSGYGINTEPSKGSSLAEIAGAQAKEGSYQNQLLGQLQAMSRNMDWDEVLTGEHAGTNSWGLVRDAEDEKMVRFWGGRGEPPVTRTSDIIKGEIADLQSKLGTANRFNRGALQVRIDVLRNELGLAMIDPDAVARDRAETLAEFGDSVRDEHGLLDTTKLLDQNEETRVVNAQIDTFLGDIKAERSSGVGRVFNYLAGRLVAGQGSYAGANSEFSSVRAVAQLMNPEMINSKVNNHNWIPDQMAISNLSRDLTKSINNLDWYRKRVKRLRGGEELRSFQEQFDIILRTKNSDERLSLYGLLSMSDKEIKQAELFYHHMFDPKTGFLTRISNHMVASRIISPSQKDSFMHNPGLAIQLIRDSVTTEEAATTIRGALKEKGKQHLSNKAAGGYFEVTLLEGIGAFMQRNMITNQAIKANFDDMGPNGQEFYLKLAEVMERNGIEVGTVDFHRAYKASEFLRREMRRPRALRSEWSAVFANSDFMERYHKAALESDNTAPVYREDGSIEADKTRAETLMSSHHGAYKPKTGLDLMAHEEFIDLKTGGKLGDSRFIGDRSTLIGIESISPYLDLDIQNRLNSFIGSNSIMSMGTSIQQHAIGIRGANTMFIIDNLLKRVREKSPSLRGDDGQPLDDIGFTRMEYELEALKNQLRAGYNMKPLDIAPETSTDLGRSLRAFSRMGVSLMSAGNFALSAIVEVIAGLPRTLGKMMHGDLKVIGDYFTMLSKNARRRVMENADGFEVTKMHLGIHTRFGDLGYDDIRDLTGYDKTSKFLSVDTLEKVSRRLSGLAMLGFTPFTDYARAVSVAQSIRQARRISANRHGGYTRLGKELSKLTGDETAKDIRGLARSIGMDPQESVHLWQSGMASENNLNRVQQLLQSKYFDDQGLNVEAIYRDGAFNDYEIATVRTILQFQNNRINLDPRMGNRIVPKNVVDQLLGVLGQFPLLFYSRMRQAAYQGGGMAVGGYLLYMLLGEMYYTNLALMSRGEDPKELLKKMASGDLGWILNTVENMNVMGSLTPIIPAIVNSSLSSLRSLTDNPELLNSYKPGIMRNPVSIAGLSMLEGSVLKVFEGSSNLFNGDTTKGLHQLAAASPLPFKQAVKITLHQGLADTQVGRTLSSGHIIRKPNAEAIDSYNAAALLGDHNRASGPLTGAREEPPAAEVKPLEKFSGDRPGAKEQKFQEWWNTNKAVVKWREQFKRMHGEEPELDKQNSYDYRKAWRAGDEPKPNPNHIVNGEEVYHWSSIGKSKDHPTMWKEEYMQKTGNDPDAVGATQDDWLSMIDSQATSGELVDKLPE